jgi:hypothetical protein
LFEAYEDLPQEEDAFEAGDKAKEAIGERRESTREE